MTSWIAASPRFDVPYEPKIAQITERTKNIYGFFLHLDKYWRMNQTLAGTFRRYHSQICIDQLYDQHMLRNALKSVKYHEAWCPGNKFADLHNKHVLLKRLHIVHQASVGWPRERKKQQKWTMIDWLRKPKQKKTTKKISEKWVKNVEARTRDQREWMGECV